MGRVWIARILVVLGALLAIASLVAGYIRYQALDTDTVQGTASELIADPEIRNQVAATLADELFANVDVEAALRERLPPAQQGLAGPIAGAISLGADNAARRLLERPRIQELWVRVVTLAHRNLIAVLEDEAGPIRTEGGNLVLDLRPLIIQLGEQVAIVGDLSSRLAPDAGLITIMEADQLETAQDLTQLMKVLGTWLWLVPIALWAIALLIARGARRSILTWIAFGAIVTGLIVLIVRRIAGSIVVDKLTNVESVEVAAHDAWNILTEQLRDGGLTLVGIGVVLLVGIWLTGASDWATDARRWAAPYVARPAIAFGAAALLLGLLVWWGPTIQLHRWQFVLASAVALALGVEVIRRQTAREFPQPNR
jgi:hypothetical protein